MTPVNTFRGAVVVIPTRNRPDLAENAIRSVVSQCERDVRVIVSDNSTTPEHLDRLFGYCKRLNERRLEYLRPPSPLPMSRHWDWALGEALKLDVNHFAILSDRMIFRPKTLGRILELIERHPDKILVYLHDRVLDFRRPFTIDLNEWTGELYEVRSARLLELTANSVMYDCSVPRLLNCLTPRSVLNAIAERFGTIVASNAPDWNFAYRALDVVDTLLYYNAPVLIHYALRHSNGESVHRGIRNDAYTNFVRELSTPFNADAPFPEIITVWNAIVSEYCSVRREAKGRIFPDLDMARYARALAWGIAAIEDPERKQEMKQKLLARGWDPESYVKPAPPASFLRRITSVRRVFRKLTTLGRPVTFDAAEDALEYAAAHPRPKSRMLAQEEALHCGTKV